MDGAEISNNAANQLDDKKPYRRIRFAVDRLVNFAIPGHLLNLKEHQNKLQLFEEHKDWQSLYSEQVNASNTIRLLKEDLFELQSISHQVIDKDLELFKSNTKTATEEVLNSLAVFIKQYPHVLDIHPKGPPGITNQSDPTNFPHLVCDTEEAADQRPNTNEVQAIEVYTSDHPSLSTPKKVLAHWSKLRNELSELNGLFKRFSSLVFHQKEHVDSLETHVQQAHDNVQEGTKHLRKAVVLQAATIPLTGALVGGLLLGPVGAAVGFKLFGSAACALSGCVMGYGAGVKIKQKRQKSCDMEMKALTAASKVSSISSPDITQIPDIVPLFESKDSAAHSS